MKRENFKLIEARNKQESHNSSSICERSFGFDFFSLLRAILKLTLRETDTEQMYLGQIFCHPKSTGRGVASSLEPLNEFGSRSRLIPVVRYTISIPRRNDRSPFFPNPEPDSNGNRTDWSSNYSASSNNLRCLIIIKIPPSQRQGGY